MKLSTRSRYAARLLVSLAAKEQNGPVLLKKIAGEEDISDKYLSQLIISLKSAGLIRSFRGAKGGYMLAKPPEDITLEDVVKVMEGGTEITACARDDAYCDRVPGCVTYPVWKGLSEVIGEYLRKYTIARLAAEVREKRGRDGREEH